MFVKCDKRIEDIVFHTEDTLKIKIMLSDKREYICIIENIIFSLSIHVFIIELSLINST